jgi:hypothetical protein
VNRTQVAVAVSFAAALSCSDEPSGTGGSVPECVGIVSTEVSAGTTPRFTWTPTCRLFLLLVEPAAAGTDWWSIISDSVNLIAPPITYGVVPSGVREGDPPAPLVAGTAYDVYLYRWTGPGAQDGVLAGSATFTP